MQVRNGSKVLTPPSLPKDYSAMMNEALAEPLPSEPARPIMSAPTAYSTEPVVASPVPAPAPAPMPVAAPVPEYTTPLPMPDPNGILPPPPAPFSPDYPTPIMPDTSNTSAQAYVDQIQTTNPAVQSMPPMTPTMAAPVNDPTTIPAPVVSTIPQNNAYAGAQMAAPTAPVAQNADPSAFQIPGM